ncbi:hypothetical protein [Teichococcus oryzae]|uniref:GH26 domain-containing protein n=1 Tax=Teichococcus oryzae TaxID=1608942 RepID=A0A5B2TBU6_9PROT|nr:hypothetical protein [Pseudoroseomonas oryzae]KAA2211318.1 hypothetical protein F0Q34_20730 [Pseudoroseomonas oryzae]
MIKHGLWFANNRQRVFDYEEFLGRRVELVRGANGSVDWKDVTSTKWIADNGKALYPRELQVCLVLWPKTIAAGTAFSQAASGAYNAYWETMLKNLISGLPGDYLIYLSPLYEGNANWFPHSFNKTYEAQAKVVFQEFGKVMKRISSRFRMIINFAEWNSDRSASFVGVFPGKEYCNDFGINLYCKDEYQGSDPGGMLDDLLNSKMGLNRMLREAQQLGVTGLWIPEWGVRPYSKNETPRERIDLTKVVQGIGDKIIQHRIHWLWWDGRGSNEAYIGPIGKGGFPKLNAAIKALDARVRQANSGQGSAPALPPVTPSPTPTPTPQPTPTAPADPALDLLAVIHEAAFAARDKHPEPANATLRQVEHTAWAARAKAGSVAGAAPADAEAPIPALARIYAAVRQGSGWDAEASRLAAAWLERALPILTEAGAVPSDPEEPVDPDPEQPDNSEEVAALKRQVTTLQAELAARNAALDAANGRLAAIQAASQALQAALA